MQQQQQHSTAATATAQQQHSTATATAVQQQQQHSTQLTLSLSPFFSPGRWYGLGVSWRVLEDARARSHAGYTLKHIRGGESTLHSLYHSSFFLLSLPPLPSSSPFLLALLTRPPASFPPFLHAPFLSPFPCGLSLPRGLSLLTPPFLLSLPLTRSSSMITTTRSRSQRPLQRATAPSSARSAP